MKTNEDEYWLQHEHIIGRCFNSRVMVVKI